jgi:hypothetical protein
MLRYQGAGRLRMLASPWRDSEGYGTLNHPHGPVTRLTCMTPAKWGKCWRASQKTRPTPRLRRFQNSDALFQNDRDGHEGAPEVGDSRDVGGNAA